MKHRVICILTLFLLLLVPKSEGSLEIRAHMDRDTFLLYESIPIDVSIRNRTGKAMPLNTNHGRSPLNFVITDGVGRLVQAVGELNSDELLSIESGETIKRTVDLLPLYDLRARGTYRVQAIIDSTEWKSSALPVRFSIVSGRKIWTDTVGIPARGETEASTREYTLLTRRDNEYDLLYVSVQDRTKDLVYGMVPLGVFIALGAPQVQADKLGNLHILFRAGPRAFVYAGIGPDARLFDAALYTDDSYLPHLISQEDGSVSVAGGIKVLPKKEVADIVIGKDKIIDARFSEKLPDELEEDTEEDTSMSDKSGKPKPITNFTTRPRSDSSISKDE